MKSSSDLAMKRRKNPKKIMSDTYQFPETLAQGFAEKATQEEIAKEETYTNPNLHRRIDNPQNPDEKPRYSVGVFGLNSYRIKEYDSTVNTDENEIP